MTAYVYKAVVLSAHDGDTFTASIDLGQTMRGKDRSLGFFIYVASKRLVYVRPLRLARCNAAELATPQGKAARDALLALMPIGTGVTVATALDPLDKWGRILADVTLSDGRNVTDEMIANGWAAPWDGKGPKPVPAGQPT